MSLENLALDITQQSAFASSVKNFHKVLEDDDGGSLKKNEKFRKGVVLLRSIPYGFFENEIRKYFRQFGAVTRVRVARSRKTGNSKGFAYVEFKYQEVAKVAAETMNNYLMFNKILKATYIPPEEQKFDYFKGVVQGKVPKDKHRKLHIVKFNRILNKVEKKAYHDKSCYRLMKKIQKLQALGIEYEFKPVDGPKSKKSKKPVLTIDESDEEITFKIPKNVTIVRKKSTRSKKANSKEKNDIEMSDVDNSDGIVDNTENKAQCNISQKNENQKMQKKMKSVSQDNDWKIKDEGVDVLESKGSRQKESSAVKSTKSPNISKPKLANNKAVGSVKSAWKVDDCS